MKTENLAFAAMGAAAMLLATCVVVAGAKSGRPTGAPEQFSFAMHSIMQKMDAGMMNTPAGSVDAQFIGMMLPHHQAAIEMAQLQLRYGTDPRLARIAQEIIIEQQQEMTVMRDVLRSEP